MLSGEDGDRRFVVVAETRRVWTRAQKKAVVDESNAAGVVVAQIARRHNLNPNLLYRWRHEFATEAAATVSIKDKPSKTSGGKAKIDREEAVSCPALPAPDDRIERDSPSSNALLEVELRNGRCLRCSPDIEPRRLAQLATALERS